MLPDVVNGLFEFGGAVATAESCRILLKHKSVRGVSKTAKGFFIVWGVWNLYYYPNLDQWWSFAGGLAIVMTNAFWLTLAIKYRSR